MPIMTARNGRTGRLPSKRKRQCKRSGRNAGHGFAIVRSPRRPASQCHIYGSGRRQEVGCIGAVHLLNSNAIDWKNMDLALCLDMLGRAPEKSMTVQTISDKTPVYLAFKKFAESRQWKVKPFVRDTLGSDAEVLQKSGAPTLFIVASGKNHHTVEDTVDNTDPQHMAQLPNYSPISSLEKIFLNPQLVIGSWYDFVFRRRGLHRAAILL